MTLLLNAKSLHKAYGVRPLFRDISISFDDSERTGLIGPNGAGKSTLLKILAGLEQADSGTTETRRNLRLGYLPQEDRFPDGVTARDVLVAALHDAQLDEHEREVKADMQLYRVGFDDPEQPAAAMSGGWRKRLAIARELVREPDLLLLDEPTNHLDLEGIVWLEELLANAPFAFVLCSHDRYFLENATNRVVELSSAYANGYLSVSGSYSDFLDQREGYLEAQAAREQSLASAVRREIEWLRRKAKARRTKAKGRIQQAGEMMAELADLKRRNAPGGAAEIDFAASDRRTKKLLTTKKVSKSLGGKPLFRDLDLVLSPGTRLGLLGPNGSGKSTLIRLLVGKEPADAGEVWRADNLQVVLFDQQRQQLQRGEPLRRALSPLGDTITYRGSSMHISGWARKFLFRTDQLDLPVGDLSGGERARVLVARLMLHPADLLILDEPTNDLDIASLEVLEESLLEFPGALVLVTHDRMMLERVSTDLLALDGEGTARPFANLAQWEAWREREATERRSDEATKGGGSRAAERVEPQSEIQSPRLKRLTYMEQRELDGIEAKIQQAEASLHTAQEKLNDPKILADRDQLHAACTAVDAAQQAVQMLYARWEDLEARKDVK